MHANGFPPQAYQELFNEISNDFQLSAPLLRSFWDHIPDTKIENWELLVEDFLKYISLQNKYENNIGIGHSIGGTILLYSIIRKPNLFSKVIILDPVLFSPYKCNMWSIIKKMGLGLYFHPLAKNALYRKQKFKSKNSIFNRYREKKIFSKLTDKSLKIYINSIFKKENDYYNLNFSSKIESDIYLSGLTLEHYIFKNIHKIQSKVYVMYADLNSTIDKKFKNILSQNKFIKLEKMVGLSHLFPMENSKKVYLNIKNFLI